MMRTPLCGPKGARQVVAQLFLKTSSVPDMLAQLLVLALVASRATADFLLSQTWIGSSCGVPTGGGVVATPVIDVALSFGCQNLTYPAGFTCTCNNATCTAFGGSCFQCFGGAGNLPAGMVCKAYPASKLSARTDCLNETHSVQYFFPTDNCYGFIEMDDYCAWAGGGVRAVASHDAREGGCLRIIGW